VPLELRKDGAKVPITRKRLGLLHHLVRGGLGETPRKFQSDELRELVGSTAQDFARDNISECREAIEDLDWTGIVSDRDEGYFFGWPVKRVRDVVSAPPDQLDSGPEETIESDGESTARILEEILLQVVTMRGKFDVWEMRTLAKPGAPNPDQLIFNLPRKLLRKVYGREQEIQKLAERLRDERAPRVLSVVAPFGYGKTALLCGVLQTVTDGKRITSSDLDGLICYECRPDLTLNDVFAPVADLAADAGLRRAMGGTSEVECRFDSFRAAIKRSWVIFQNCESLLDAHGHFLNEDIDRFVSLWLRSPNTEAKLILESRVMPELKNGESLGTLAFGDSLLPRLPASEAVAWLREIGESCGLQNEPEHLLLSLVERFHGIPQWIENAITFLRGKYPAYRFPDFLKDENLLAEFASQDDLVRERGFRRLVREHIMSLPEPARHLLELASTFGSSVPHEALEAFLSRPELVEPLRIAVGSQFLRPEQDTSGHRRYRMPEAVRAVVVHLKVWEPELAVIFRLARKGLEIAKTGDQEVAHEMLLTSVALLSRPENNELHVMGRAVLLLGVASLRADQGRTVDAVIALDNMLALSRAYAGSGTELAYLLAIALAVKGGCLIQIDCVLEAIASFEAAEAVFGTLYDDNEPMVDEPRNLTRLTDFGLFSHSVNILDTQPLALTLAIHAAVLNWLLHPEKAEPLCHRASNIYRRLYDAGVADIRQEFAFALMEEAHALDATGDRDAALDKLKEGLTILECFAPGPTKVDRLVAAQALIRFAEFLYVANKSREARPYCDRAIMLLDHPSVDSVANRTLLARGLNLNARFMCRLGQYSEALRECFRAMALCGDASTSREARRVLADLHCTKGNILSAAGHKRESLNSYAQAVEAAEVLVDAGRPDTAYQLAVYLEHYQLSLGLFGTKKAVAVEVSQRRTRIYEELRESGHQGLECALACSLTSSAFLLLISRRGREAAPLVQQAIDLMTQVNENTARRNIGDFVDVMLELSRIYFVARRFEKASGFFNAAISALTHVLEAGMEDVAGKLADLLLRRAVVRIIRFKFAPAFEDWMQAAKLLATRIRAKEGRASAPWQVRWVPLALVPLACIVFRRAFLGERLEKQLS